MDMQPISANFEYYKVFYFVVKSGSLTAAAERLCLTQPTITKTIQNLELQLNCKLFVRSKCGMKLTASGNILWKRVEPACHLFLAAERELDAVQHLNGGTLSIASTEMSLRTYVLPAMEEFIRDFPNVKIWFRNALTQSILKMLYNGEIDLAILHKPFQTEEWMQVRQIGKIEERFVAGPRFAFLAQEPQDLEQLLQYPLISVLEGSATKTYARELFQRYGLEYEPDIEVTTIDLVVQAAKRNFGIAMLPMEHIKGEVARGELFCIQAKVPLLERDACVITHKDAFFNPAASTFLNRYLLSATEN